jgi:hypothetical protein
LLAAELDARGLENVHKVLGTHGGDRKSAKAGENQADNVSLNGYGNRAAYLLARLDRDRPDLATKVRGHASAPFRQSSALFLSTIHRTSPNGG